MVTLQQRFLVTAAAVPAPRRDRGVYPGTPTSVNSSARLAPGQKSQLTEVKKMFNKWNEFDFLRCCKRYSSDWGQSPNDKPVRQKPRNSR
jgi:hypothetical protein